MRVALLSNTAWLDEELPLYKSLILGLMDEQVNIVQVVPEALSVQESIQLGSRIVWKDSTWDTVRSYRLGRLRYRLDSEQIDLVHALDGRLWTSAIKLATQLQCPAILTANSYMDIPLAEKLLKNHATMRLGIAVSTEPLAEALAPLLGEQHILQKVPPGVTSANKSGSNANTEVKESSSQMVCAVISAGGGFDVDFESLFLGLRPIINSFPQIQFFIDSPTHDQHLIWQAASKLELLSHISLIPRRLGHRELILNADALIHPQPMGRSRGLTLQAMARGMAVIAHADQWLDYLIHGQTAWVVERPHPELWTLAIERLLSKPQDGKELGHKARQWVLENRLASSYVSSTVKLYKQVTGESYKFPGR